MTRAVCTKCGEWKLGALTRCLSCGFDPVEPDDQARAIILSDRSKSESELEEARATLQGGQAIHYSEQDVAELATTAAETQLPWGCLVAPWLLIGLTALMGAAVVFLWLVQ